jgi:GDSL-like Lipase/Acylhydrolase family
LKRIAASVALAAASFGLCALALEVGARVVAHRWSSHPGAIRDPLVRYHPTLGWDKPPGAEGWIRRTEYNVHLVINAHGLRGPDRGYEKPRGVHRTLLLGDSFAEGYTVAEEATVRAGLERLLDAMGCARHEVLNGGTAAYSTDQEYLFFLEEGARYQPDVVVLLFFYNDLVGDTPGGLEKPRFDVVEGRLVLRNSPVPPPPPGRREARPFAVKPWRGSVALRLLSDRTARANPRLHRLLARLGLVEPETDEAMPRELWPFGPGHKDDVALMWRRAGAILAALKDAALSRGARLVVFYVPARFEVDDAAWELTREKNAMGRRWWRRERVFEDLRETCQSLGLPLVDPREEMRAAEVGGRRAYFVRDGHWTAEGHAVAARRIAAALAGEGLACPR